MHSAEEWQQRFQQQANWTASLQSYLSRILDFSKMERILETGCGTGAVCRSLSQFLNLSTGTQPQLFGMDLRLDFLQLAACPTACADGFQLPFEDQTFDAVFCHYFLLWIKNPAQILQEMRRITRAQGYVIAFAEPDYGGRIDYPEALIQIGQMQTQALAGQGADPFIGRKLPALFHQAGLENIHSGVLGGEWASDQLSNNWESEWKTLEHDLQNTLSKDEIQHFRQIEAAARLKGERILYIPTFYCWGQKRI